MELTSNVTDTALIFEGGGMRASYTSAVVKTLLENEIHLDWVGGISAGSSNTANYVSRDGDRAKKSFVDFAADPKFGDLRTFVRGQGLFNAHYIYEQTSGPDQALPFDFDTFINNPAKVRIGAIRCEDAEMFYWGREELNTLNEVMRRVRASSSMPGLMPFVNIDGVEYCDGALGPSGGIPIDAAMADGYDKFLVILTRPRNYVKKPTRFTRAYDAIFRRYPAVAAAVQRRAGAYNRTRDQLLELERQGKAMIFFPDQMPVSNRTKSVPQLQASFDLGYAQARRELPKWREFLNLDR